MIYALHGMMGHCSDWDALELDLKAVELWQAFSGSDKPDLESWAQSFNGSVSDDNEKILIGYSMGGRLALHVLLNQPNIWKGAVVISTHPGLQDDGERKTRLEDDLQWASRARDLSWSDFLVQWNDQAVLKIGGKSKSQATLEDSRDSVALAFECWSLGNQADLRSALSECSVPILWITGALDEKFTALAAEVAASNARFEYVAIPGAGHRLLFESGDPLKMLKSLIGDFQKRIL